MKRRLSDSDSSMSNVGGSRRRSRKKRTGPAAAPSEVSSSERQQTLKTTCDAGFWVYTRETQISLNVRQIRYFKSIVSGAQAR